MTSLFGEDETNERQDEQLTFDLDHFNDPAILQSTCMVCALPLHVRKKLEQSVFTDRERPIPSIADEYNLLPTDIEDHINNCVLDRNTLIPMGKLIKSLVEETESFITNFARFKTALIDGGEIDADGVTAYSTAMDKLRVIIRDFKTMQSPDYVAGRIRQHVINPLIVLFYRALAEEMNYLMRESNRFVPERQRAEFLDMIKNLNKRIGIKHKEGMDNIQIALAEQTGANPKSIGKL